MSETDLRALMRAQALAGARQDAHIQRAAREQAVGRDEQLPLLPEMPLPGERWWNEGIGRIVTVMRLEQRRQCWITIRVNNEEHEMSLPGFLNAYRRL